MKNKLELLLNMLIQRGWKPYGIDKDDIEVCEYEKKRKKISIGYMDWESPSKGDYDWLFISLRELVSKESGLWQFVCENGMLNANNGVRANAVDCCLREILFNYDNYQYRIIESALCDEDKLEEFLLDNIKIDAND